MPRISVIAADKTVIVDGVAFTVEMDWPAGLHAMHWNAGGFGLPGRVEEQGDSHGFSDPARIQPFVEAWAKAKAHRNVKIAELVAQQEAEAQVAAQAETEQQASIDKQNAEAAKRADYITALSTLGTSDHEVIKAMEAKLAEEGRLSPEFVEQRRQAREVAKAEKTKLGL